jgi:hypothetical protein
MAAGRNTMSTRLAFLAPNPKEPKRSRASRQEIWFGQLSRAARNKASTWDECWSGPVAHLIYRPNTAGYKASTIASVRRVIAAMAIATRSVCSMDRIAPKRPLGKERAIPPPDESRGHLGMVLVNSRDGIARKLSLYLSSCVHKCVNGCSFLAHLTQQLNSIHCSCPALPKWNVVVKLYVLLCATLPVRSLVSVPYRCLDISGYLSYRVYTF